MYYLNLMYEDFLEDGRAPLLNGSRPPDPENVNSYLKTIAKRFPTVMNRLVQIKHHNLALMPEDERNDYCKYENELTAVKNRENLIKISGDVGAVALSFAGGIIGRGAVLATAAGRARLIEWGVVGSSEAYLAMSALSDYQQLISTCDRQFSDFTNTPNSQIGRASCRERVSPYV